MYKNIILVATFIYRIKIKVLGVRFIAILTMLKSFSMQEPFKLTQSLGVGREKREGIGKERERGEFFSLQ